ncbi:glucose dehydrogenase [FAD, quinone]-like [Chironomus tepperi]|uniref:glucose dehydrogenase [FAD, quinone]-like n=1 Tax=Chironomus tepperi TaxID=113505 RepID=UPI00391EEF6B
MNYYIYFVIIATFKFFTHYLNVIEVFMDRDLPADTIYDYIIVGSGSSGGVIASNLKGKVLLIEAGGYGSGFLFNIPIVQPLLLRSDYDWKHETVPQDNSCKGMNDNTCFWPTGKIISGTHRLNNMIYHRGHSVDYAEFFDDPKDANKYFEMNEESIPVSETNFKTVVSQAFIQAGKMLGFNDFNYVNLTQQYGKRYTEFYNWWGKILEPKNAILNALVTKVIFKEHQKIANGIEFIKNGKHHQVYGKKIVLAAGTMGSPKILLHSGIGPKYHLNEMRIDVVEDLPVGENLQDHVTTNIEILLNQTGGCSLKDIYNPLNVIDYFINGNGPLALAGSDAMGFVNLNISSDIPDISFIMIPISIADDYGLHLRKAINIKDEIWNQYYEPLLDQSIATILPIILHPESRGYLRLRSRNISDPLLINPNYYDAQNDVKNMTKAIRIIQKLIETPPMKKFGAEMIPKKLPGCESNEENSDAYWECYIRHLTLTMYHPIGTCKLGDYDDKTTVVLKNFQVKNVKNLYVVDGSIIPKATSANPHALISMLAHKFTYEMNLINAADE